MSSNVLSLHSYAPSFDILRPVNGKRMAHEELETSALSPNISFEDFRLNGTLSARPMLATLGPDIVLEV